MALGDDTTGNYVATVASGSGVTSSVTTGEGAATALSLGALTADWTQSGAYDVVLSNASSELKIKESAGDTYYGIFDTGNLDADRTYTFPNVSGTVRTTGTTDPIILSAGGLNPDTTNACATPAIYAVGSNKPCLVTADFDDGSNAEEGVVNGRSV